MNTAKRQTKSEAKNPFIILPRVDAEPTHTTNPPPQKNASIDLDTTEKTKNTTKPKNNKRRRSSDVDTESSASLSSTSSSASEHFSKVMKKGVESAVIAKMETKTTQAQAVSTTSTSSKRDCGSFQLMQIHWEDVNFSFFFRRFSSELNTGTIIIKTITIKTITIKTVTRIITTADAQRTGSRVDHR